MSQPVIRRARLEDAETIARMVVALSAAEGGPAPDFDAATCRRDGFGPRPLFSTILAEIDGRPAGYALYHPSYDTDRIAGEVWLADLYVESWARGAGLGRRLAAKVASLGAARGDEAMRWGVLRRNAAARRFYTRFAREDETGLHCFTSHERTARLAVAAPRSAARIRPATRGDAATIGRLVGELVRVLGHESPGFDPTPRLAVDGFGPDPKFAAVIAEFGSEAAGYALFWPIYDTETGGPLTFLSDLMVTPPWRGRGLAEDLMAAVAARALDAGHLGISWEVDPDNLRARAFYRRIAEESDEVLTVTCAGEDFRRLAAEETPQLA